jgi:hypothetical protein
LQPKTAGLDPDLWAATVALVQRQSVFPLNDN